MDVYESQMMREVSMRRSGYRSDLKDAEWAILEPYIPEPLPGGRPADYERREIVNGILYVLRTGCGWEYLPHDLPPWKTVYYYFREWKRVGIWEEANAALTRRSRERQGREATPSLAIIDTQSTHTTEKGG
jgi:putative transposase